ncbi:MAG: DUF1648 domain-containing protein [Acidobacteriota bacterium]|jgi:uncharacterized membrane protein
MEDKGLLFLMLVETAVVGGIFLLYPRVARKGLLFGVYVGESAFEGKRAQEITRSWYRWMIVALIASLAGGAALFLTAARPLAAVAPIYLILLASLALYLRAYYQARSLAMAGPPPDAVAPAITVPATSALLPVISLVAAVACGLVAVAYTWTHYADLPARIPTHFDGTGRPDAWRDKSLMTAMLPSLMTLVLGTMLGGMAWLTAHAKRALRRADHGASLQAQMQFRTAMARLLSALAILTTGMLTFMSIQTTRVALGEAESLGSMVTILGVGMGVVALGGVVYIAVHYGQGGSRLERARADTPLTNGLADNRNWYLGVFYVNRDDPSILVERRFGIGYTLNLGNRMAIALLVGFLAIVIAIAVASAS